MARPLFCGVTQKIDHDDTAFVLPLRRSSYHTWRQMAQPDTYADGDRPFGARLRCHLSAAIDVRCGNEPRGRHRSTGLRPTQPLHCGHRIRYIENGPDGQKQLSQQTHLAPRCIAAIETISKSGGRHRSRSAATRLRSTHGTSHDALLAPRPHHMKVESDQSEHRPIALTRHFARRLNDTTHSIRRRADDQLLQNAGPSGRIRTSASASFPSASSAAAPATMDCTVPELALCHWQLFEGHNL